MSKGVIYSNPSGDKSLKNVLKDVLNDPTYKPTKGGEFNVNKMKQVKVDNTDQFKKDNNNVV